MGKIYWLASYPKSGNTWVRVFLTNYWRNADEPAHINQLEATPLASSRPLFEDYTGLETSDLTADEIDFYRPEVYRHWAADHDDTIYVKVHDSHRVLPDGRPLFPPEITAGAIYLVRNPLDITISFAAHFGWDLDTTIRVMAQEDIALEARGGQGGQVRQVLGSWSSHVRGWCDAAAEMPLRVVRYEDLCRNPEATFGEIMDFIGSAVDEGRIRKAMEFSRFGILQEQERADGFTERPGQSSMFFRQGMAGAWRRALSHAQVEQLIADHAAMMERIGYLSADGDIMA